MIDKGNFAGAIDRLENDASCQSAYSGNEYRINLGVAYMGKAGLGVSDVISTMATASDQGGGDTFGSFLDAVNEKTDNNTLSNLKKAKDEFVTYLGGVECNATTTYAQDDACLYIGLSDILKASTTFGYLTDNVQEWVTDANNTEMDASACALEYAVTGGCTNGGGVAVVDANITFDSNRTYDEINVTVGADSYYYLVALPTPPSSTVLTDGYCTTSFVSCPDVNATCYACPVSQSAAEEDLNVTNLLVDALNSGFDSVSTLVDGDPALQADIDAFKAEVSGGGDITVNDIITYLNN